MSDKAKVMEPLIKKVDVALPIEDAFALFTEEMGEWWPAHTHSIATDTFDGRVTVVRLVFEGFVGGRIYEVMSDGREGDWGVVLVFDRPTKVVFSWNPSLVDRPSTEVEVRFSKHGEHTQVVLEHRGWERLGESGADFRRGYESGWDPVLDRLVEFSSKRAS